MEEFILLGLVALAGVYLFILGLLQYFIRKKFGPMQDQMAKDMAELEAFGKLKTKQERKKHLERVVR